MKSYAYLEQQDVFLLPVHDIQLPVRDPGVNIYRSIEDYLRLKKMMLAGEIIDPIEIRSKEKARSEKYQVYDGCHRLHLSMELGYEYIPLKINDWDMLEFLNGEHVR
jgi:hypothetical protein